MRSRSKITLYIPEKSPRSLLGGFETFCSCIVPTGVKLTHCLLVSHSVKMSGILPLEFELNDVVDNFQAEVNLLNQNKPTTKKIDISIDIDENEFDERMIDVRIKFEFNDFPFENLHLEVRNSSDVDRVRSELSRILSIL